MPAHDVEILITPEGAQVPVYIHADTIAVVQEDLRGQFDRVLGLTIELWNVVDLDNLAEMGDLHQTVGQLKQLADALASFAVELPEEDAS